MPRTPAGQTAAPAALELPASPWWALLVLAVIHTLYNSSLQLYLDEAYYWVWSRHLQLSYYDHPPMVAYLIRLATLACESEACIRLAAVFCMTLTGWYLFRLGELLGGCRTAWAALAIWAVLPLTNLGYTIVSPDAPLFLFWSAGLYHAWRILFEDGGWPDFLATGLAIGGMLLSKYTGVLFPVFLLVFVLWRRPRLLRDGRTWLAAGVAFLLVLPVIWWNARHDWVSFRFQYGHGSSGDWALRPDLFFEFLGGLFLVFSPVFMGLLLWGLVRNRRLWRDDRLLYLLLAFAIPLGFFLYKGLFKKMQLNWPAMAFIAATLLLAWLVTRHGLRRWFAAGIALALAIDLLLFFPTLFPLRPEANFLNRVHGPREVVERAAAYLQPGDALLADHLTLAAMFSYYTPGHPPAHVPTPSRFSQYDLWDQGLDVSSLPGIYIATENRDDRLGKSVHDYRLLEVFVARRPGFRDKPYHIYRVNETTGKEHSRP